MKTCRQNFHDDEQINRSNHEPSCVIIIIFIHYLLSSLSHSTIRKMSTHDSLEINRIFLSYVYKFKQYCKHSKKKKKFECIKTTININCNYLSRVHLSATVKIFHQYVCTWRGVLLLLCLKWLEVSLSTVAQYSRVLFWASCIWWDVDIDFSSILLFAVKTIQSECGLCKWSLPQKNCEVVSEVNKCEVSVKLWWVSIWIFLIKKKNNFGRVKLSF